MKRLIGLIILILFMFACNKKGGYAGNWTIGYSDDASVSENGVQLKIGEKFIDSSNFESPLDFHFLADPFLFKNSSGVYLFCEHLQKGKGNIWCFYSQDTLNIHFKYIGNVLDEPFHLSYPQVFRVNNTDYMLPETQGSGTVRLYTTSKFPYNWKFEKVLINKKVKDPTILIQSDGVYIFGSIRDNLYYWFSDSLNGNFKQSEEPLISGVESRPGGRIFRLGSKIILPLQNHGEGYGTGVSFYTVNFSNGGIILQKEKVFFLKPEPGIPQFKAGMHHFDFIELNGKYLCVYDGHDRHT